MIWVILVLAAIDVAIVWVLWKGTSGPPNTGAERDESPFPWMGEPIASSDDPTRPSNSADGT